MHNMSQNVNFEKFVQFIKKCWWVKLNNISNYLMPRRSGPFSLNDRIYGPRSDFDQSYPAFTYIQWVTLRCSLPYQLWTRSCQRCYSVARIILSLSGLHQLSGMRRVMDTVHSEITIIRIIHHLRIIASMIESLCSVIKDISTFLLSFDVLVFWSPITTSMFLDLLIL